MAMGGKGDLKTIKMDPGIFKIVRVIRKIIHTPMFFLNYIYLILKYFP